jgi:UDP-N-acetylglucosamine 1-carboxyvinyltransferase
VVISTRWRSQLLNSGLFQMADLIVNGGKPLSGTITPSGNKNSVLPILCATLLTDEPVALLNVPDITDV